MAESCPPHDDGGRPGSETVLVVGLDRSAAGRRSRAGRGIHKPASPQQLVLEFHEAFRLPVRHLPSIPPGAEAALRECLLRDEIDELTRAVAQEDLIAVADALGDIVYVVYGTALTYGIDLDAVVAEVHRANMSKLAHDGRTHLRDDGKVLKGPEYRPPDIQGVLNLRAQS